MRAAESQRTLDRLHCRGIHVTGGLLETFLHIFTYGAGLMRRSTEDLFLNQWEMGITPPVDDAQ